MDMAAAGIRYLQKDKGLYEKFHYRAPSSCVSVIVFCCLQDTLSDFKTEHTDTAFVPCMNFYLKCSMDRPCHDTRQHP